MADFWSGFAQGLGSTAGKGSAKRMEREKFEYQKQQDALQNNRAERQMGMAQEQLNMQKEEFAAKKAESKRQQDVSESIAIGVKIGGFSGAVQTLKDRGHGKEALEMEKAKADYDNAVASTAQTKTMTEKAKQEMLQSNYVMAGHMATSVLGLPPEQQADAWAQMYPMYEAMAPGQFSPAWNGNTQAKLTALVALATPEELKFQAKKAFGESQQKVAGIQQQISQLKATSNAQDKQRAQELQKDLDQGNVEAAEAKMKIIDAELKTTSAKADVLMQKYQQDTASFRTSQEYKNRADGLMAAQRKDPTSYNDIGLVYAIMKMADTSPANSVREGEQATAQNAGSVPSWIVAKYNQLVTGKGKLDDKQREQMYGTINIFYDSSKKAYENTRSEYKKIGEQYGIPAEKFMPDYKQKIDQATAESIQKDPTIPNDLKQAAQNAIQKGVPPQEALDRVHDLMKQQRGNEQSGAPQMPQGAPGQPPMMGQQ